MIIAGRQGMMGGRKPYDAEVEYLETTGTQFIKTNIVPMIGDSIKMRFSTTRTLSNTWEQLMGSGSGTYQLCFPTGKDSYGELVYCRVFGGGPAWSAGKLITPVSNGIQNLDVRYLGDNQYKVSVGDVSVDQMARGEINGYVTNMPLHLFYRPTVGGAYIKCYSFLLYNDSGKSLDLIPVRVGTVGYMYDRVSGQLFGNSGTGAFVLGADI